MDPSCESTLRGYLERLLAVNERMNLTALREPSAAWEQLVLESLDLLPFLDDVHEGARVIDVGSGGGSPAIPLAVARPDLGFTLVEATAKKARFLQEAAAELHLHNVEVVAERAETLARDPRHRDRYDVATARAVGELRVLLELTLPFLKDGGILLAPKGPKAEDELRAAKGALHRLGGTNALVVPLTPDRPEAQEKHRVVVRVEKAGKTPKDYPRAPGMPKTSPL